MKSKVIYWRAGFPTNRLKELCRWSQSKRWYEYKKKHFARRASCEDANGFRFAVVKEIERLRDELAEKQKLGFDCVRARMNPHKRKGDQHRRELNPATEACSLYANVRMKCASLMESAQQWNDATRAYVMRSLEDTERFLAGERRKLQR